MKKYIIKRTMIVNGKMEILYFSNITPSHDRTVMNVFKEHLVAERTKAKRFYDKAEAQRFCDLFTHIYAKSKVINL